MVSLANDGSHGLDSQGCQPTVYYCIYMQVCCSYCLVGYWQCTAYTTMAVIFVHVSHQGDLHAMGKEGKKESPC